MFCLDLSFLTRPLALLCISLYPALSLVLYLTTILTACLLLSEFRNTQSAWNFTSSQLAASWSTDRTNIQRQADSIFSFVVTPKAADNNDASQSLLITAGEPSLQQASRHRSPDPMTFAYPQLCSPYFPSKSLVSGCHTRDPEKLTETYGRSSID